MGKTKEEWKEVILRYLEKNKSKWISIFEIFSMNGGIPKELKEAVEELEIENNKINVEINDEGKKWLKCKD